MNESNENIDRINLAVKKAWFSLTEPESDEKEVPFEIMGGIISEAIETQFLEPGEMRLKMQNYIDSVIE